MAGKIFGRAEILANGVSLLIKENAVASGIGGGASGEGPVERSEVMAESGLAGFVEKPVVAKLTFTLIATDATDLDALAAINGDGTIIFRSYKGGLVLTMPQATCLTPLEITAGQGDTAVVFGGSRWVPGASSV